MHELSIAQNILEIVRQHVPEQDWGLLRSVRLRIGSQAGVVTESLRFGWEALTADGPLASSRLEVQTVPFTLRCLACGRTSAPAEGVALCAECGSPRTEILGGTELQVVELELEDPPGETA
jgi:hydrogenase nickel incorporation protein HypA/HybF